MKTRRSLLLLLALVALVGAVWSFLALSLPPQQTLDQQVAVVGAQLKCPVCQGESVASSSATIAGQMRQVIRQQLQAGRSEQQVLQYFAARYGNQILLTPPQQGLSELAWVMPVAMLLLGMGLVSLVGRDWYRQSRVQFAHERGQENDAPSDDSDLEPYRVQLEQELADDGILFHE